jgi:hypothetical protein
MAECEPRGPVSPENFLAANELTKRLKKLGLTNRQLGAVRFTGLNNDWPFNLWSFTWGHGTPQTAIGHLKAFAALKWLVLESPPHSRDKEDAQRLVNDILAQPALRNGLSFNEAQRARALRPRGALTSDGRNMNEFISSVALDLAFEKRVKELWPIFIDELRNAGLHPEVQIVRDLAREMLTQPEALRGCMADLSIGEQRMSIAFGKAIAELADDPLIWEEPVKSAYASVAEGSRNYGLIAGYYSGLSTRNPDAVAAYKHEAVHSAVYSHTLPFVCLLIGITASDVRLVCESLKAGVLPPGAMSHWGMGGVFAKLDAASVTAGAAASRSSRLLGRR